MKITAKYTLTLLTLVVSTAAFSQLPSSGQTTVLDGVYQQTHIPTKRVIAYSPLREADVLWSKRVWRVIDLKERINYPLYYPTEPLSDRMALWDVIKYGVMTEGSLTIYEGDKEGEQFYKPILPPNGNRQDPEYVKLLESRYFGTEVSIPDIDQETGDIRVDIDGNEVYVDRIDPYNAESIIEYRIKEEWFFDKQRSQMDVRIIGIAPVAYLVREGIIQGKQVLFWLYFPEARYVFQNFFVYNSQNDAMRMSFDDLFWKRRFGSYIYQESNVFDRLVMKEANDGIEQLLISERIKEEIFKIEHDLWHY
jgi:gliding motility associated protien GldN